jgi:hypothetical protein
VQLNLLDPLTMNFRKIRGKKEKGKKEDQLGGG